MINTHLLSLFFQGQVNPVKELQLTAGARFDSSDYYGEVFTPRLALVYNRNKWTGKILYNQAFRAPKPWDYTYGAGNPDLLPEEMSSLEISTGYSVSRNLRLELNYFANRLRRVLVIQNINSKWFWDNLGRIDTQGLEAGVALRKGRLQTSAWYTYTLSTDSSGNIIPEIGKHNAQIGLSYALTKHFRFSLRGHYIGRRENPKIIASTGETLIEPVFLLHSVLSLRDIKGFDFFLIAKNLLDAEYYHPSNRPPDRYRQQQRTILIKAAYRF